MERAWSGRDEVAELFDEHASRAFRYARALGLSHADADDVVAESFLRVVRSRLSAAALGPRSSKPLRSLGPQRSKALRSRAAPRSESGAPSKIADYNDSDAVLTTAGGAFRGDAGFRTWLFRIVRNQVLDLTRARSRRRGRHEARGAQARAAVADVPDGSAEEKEMRAAVAEALALLGPDERAALILVTAGELSYRGAAAVEGVSATALASRVFRARQAIRKHLAGLGLMPDGPDDKRLRPTGEV